MAKELAVYVSASPEMDAECELLGQLLAGLIPSIQWTIKRTPGRRQRANPDANALQNSHFFVMLLGMDIKAPMGVEWNLSGEFGLARFIYRKVSVSSSPATSYFVHHSAVEWQPYRHPRGFVQRFERDLLEELVKGTPGYGLQVRHIAEVVQRLDALRQWEGAEMAQENRRGAGRGGVILPSD